MKRHTIALGALMAGLVSQADAQQLISGLTDGECTARGGSIRTWTSSVGVTPPRGECYVPPRISNGGGGNRAPSASTAGAVGGFVGALGNFIGTLSDIQADREQRERQWEDDLRAQRAQHMQATRAQEGALLEQEARLREQERQRSAAANATTSSNPFAANPFASNASGTNAPTGSNPFAANVPASPLKSDQQIKAECAQSGNPSVCELTAFSARANDPGYQRWKAAENARLDENVRRSKAEVDRLIAERERNRNNQPDSSGNGHFPTGTFDSPAAARPTVAGSGDPDLDRCREGENAPSTIAGCYDLGGRNGAKPAPHTSLRDELRRALARGNEKNDDDDTQVAPPTNVTATTSGVPQQQPKPADRPAAAPDNSPWAAGPWRTNDASACQAAGGMLVKPAADNDLTGIPQSILDNPSIPKEQLAATAYCNDMRGFAMSGSGTAAEIRRLTAPLPQYGPEKPKDWDSNNAPPQEPAK